MNRAEHHAAAEKLIAAAGDISIGDTVTGYTRQLVLMTAAQVHAMLASTDLVPMPPPPIPDSAADRSEEETGRLIESVGAHRGSRSYGKPPFKLTCRCAGNGDHERGVFVGCLWTLQISDGPGQ